MKGQAYRINKIGKYEITEKAVIIIKDMEKLEDKTGERINASI
jgi:hypothetical protein